MVGRYSHAAAGAGPGRASSPQENREVCGGCECPRLRAWWSGSVAAVLPAAGEGLGEAETRRWTQRMTDGRGQRSPPYDGVEVGEDEPHGAQTRLSLSSGAGPRGSGDATEGVQYDDGFIDEDLYREHYYEKEGDAAEEKGPEQRLSGWLRGVMEEVEEAEKVQTMAEEADMRALGARAEAACKEAIALREQDNMEGARVAHAHVTARREADRRV